MKHGPARFVLLSGHVGGCRTLGDPKLPCWLLQWSKRETPMTSTKLRLTSSNYSTFSFWLKVVIVSPIFALTSPINTTTSDQDDSKSSHFCIKVCFNDSVGYWVLFCWVPEKSSLLFPSCLFPSLLVSVSTSPQLPSTGIGYADLPLGC